MSPLNWALVLVPVATALIAATARIIIVAIQAIARIVEVLIQSRSQRDNRRARSRK